MVTRLDLRLWVIIWSNRFSFMRGITRVVVCEIARTKCSEGVCERLTVLPVLSALVLNRSTRTISILSCVFIAFCKMGSTFVGRLEFCELSVVLSLLKGDSLRGRKWQLGTDSMYTDHCNAGRFTTATASFTKRGAVKENIWYKNCSHKTQFRNIGEACFVLALTIMCVAVFPANTSFSLSVTLYCHDDLGSC
jgi:hypothetical protein